MYEIKSDNYLTDLKYEFKEIMDFSNFDCNHELFDESHKKEIGYLKAEYGEKFVNEFVGNKSKLYSIKYDNSCEKNVAKGLQNAVIKKFVKHDNYKNCILHNTLYSHKMNRIQFFT